MKTPSAADIVRVWELGREKPGWYRGLLMLAPAFPDLYFKDLSVWPLGRRNIALFKLRAALFSHSLTCVAACPKCGRSSEFSAAVGDLCPHDLDPSSSLAEEHDLEVAGRALRIRLLTSLDLANAREPSLSIEHPDLLRQAVLTTETEWEDLPAGAHSTIADRLYELDPQVELQMGVVCSNCGHEWSSPFDIAGYLWTEIGGMAQRLMQDVHLMARAYGWREADILAMSSARRQFYVGKIGA
jgi:hypothetical protein